MPVTGDWMASARSNSGVTGGEARVAVAQIRTLGVLVAALFGCISAWKGRFDMDPDGMSYLDVAEAYARFDWANALNSIWSPLYSLMLIPVLSGLKSDAYWEFPLVHGANLLVYLGALGALTYCLRQLVLYRHWRAASETSPAAVRAVPDWLVYAVGYVLFMWAALIAVGVTSVTPHMTMVALLLLTTGLLLQLRMHPEAWRHWVAFGFVLGLTYLARPQTLVFVMVYFMLAVLPLPAGWDAKRVMLRSALAVAIFAIVASLYAVPLFVVKKQIAGRDLVRLNYAWYVNNVFIRHWQGDPPYGSPLHPTRVLLTAPTVFEFDGPVGGTYPPWYDPSYWYRGVEPQIDLSGMARRWSASVQWEPFGHLVPLYWWANVALYVLVIGLLVGRRLLPWSKLQDHAALLIPALIALGAYPALTILPRRFLGGFLIVLWLGTVASVSWRASRLEDARRATRIIAGVVVYHLLLSTVVVGARAVNSLVAPAPHVQWQVAQGLHASGVPQGSKVAIIGGTVYSYWARLARVRIVAEIQEKFAPEFWGASDERKREVAAKLQTIGVKAVVVHPKARPASSIPDDGGPWRWSELDDTRYLVLILR